MKTSSIDTPEFRKLLDDIVDENLKKAWPMSYANELIAYIDAQLAQRYEAGYEAGYIAANSDNLSKLCEVFGIKVRDGLTPMDAIACYVKDLKDALARAPVNQPAAQDPGFAAAWALVRHIPNIPDGVYVQIKRALLAPRHNDDYSIDCFAQMMKEKMAKARAAGRGGWDDPDQCSVEYLNALLLEHVQKGDPVDVANFCMMMRHYNARISVPAPQPLSAPAGSEQESGAA